MVAQVHKFAARRQGIEVQHFLGKKSARPNAIKFKLKNYLNLPEIKVPPVFGHINNDIPWGQLGNDVAGCCVVAGAAHEHMLWQNAVSKQLTPFTAEGVLKQYAKASGWNGKTDDASDTGLDMQEFASRRRKTGIIDSKGNIHRVTAYASVDNVDSLIKAAYVFGAVGLGIRFPQSAGKQFDQQQPWSVVAGSREMGGHYIPVVGVNSRGHIVCITWGRLQAMTRDFVAKYMDETVVYISDDYFDKATKVTPRNFDSARLEADLSALAS